jgi:hypothetical protein
MRQQQSAAALSLFNLPNSSLDTLLTKHNGSSTDVLTQSPTKGGGNGAGADSADAIAKLLTNVHIAPSDLELVNQCSRALSSAIQGMAFADPGQMVLSFDDFSRGFTATGDLVVAGAAAQS